MERSKIAWLIVTGGFVAVGIGWFVRDMQQLTRDMSAYQSACAAKHGFPELRANYEWRCMQSLDTIPVALP